MKKNLIIGIGVALFFLIILTLTAGYIESGHSVYRDSINRSMILLGIIIYFYISLIYMDLAYVRIAQKNDTKNTWLALVPIANSYLLSKIAHAHWWPTLLPVLFILYMPFYILLTHFLIDVIALFIVVLFVFFIISWQWKVFERLKRPGWWSLSLLIPGVGICIINLVLFAWRDSGFFKIKEK